MQKNFLMLFFSILQFLPKNGKCIVFVMFIGFIGSNDKLYIERLKNARNRNCFLKNIFNTLGLILQCFQLYVFQISIILPLCLITFLGKISNFVTFYMTATYVWLGLINKQNKNNPFSMFGQKLQNRKKRALKSFVLNNDLYYS